jgi:hypothetical protein
MHGSSDHQHARSVRKPGGSTSNEKFSGNIQASCNGWLMVEFLAFLLFWELSVGFFTSNDKAVHWQEEIPMKGESENFTEGSVYY